MTIKILPARLANQIAAGEVVERPSSVIKELIENSLDAGATHIDIYVERGGSKMIRIRDNGCGIPKDELTLALSRHATSKVESFEDLETIMSLGFRGEALASVSSVSRLKLVSKPAAQEEAWQAYAEGRDMEVKVIPAAHPDGTTVEVSDLFFNTPARRKFLRTEKTEFSHIDEVVKRIALSRFDVHFGLYHNGKVVRRLPACKTEEAQDRRVGMLCGKLFIDNALKIDTDYDDIKLRGWVALPSGCKQQNDVQYSYVNGRMMRDKLINHGIRQAYDGHIGSEFYPAYVLYLDIDPRQVDVNVHPAKHEVRFHQARLIHDFILQAVSSALIQPVNGIVDADQEDIHSTHQGENNWIEPVSDTSQQQSFDGLSTSTREGNEYPGQTSQLNFAQQATGDVSQSDTGSVYSQQRDQSSFSSIGESTTSARSNQGASGWQTGDRARSVNYDKPSAKAISGYQRSMDKLADAEPGDIAIQSQGSSHNERSSLVFERDKKQLDSGLMIHSVFAEQFLLATTGEQLWLIDCMTLITQQLNDSYLQGGLIGQPLLLPVRINHQEARVISDIVDKVIRLLGFDYQNHQKFLIIKKVPAFLRHSDIVGLFNDLLDSVYSLCELQGTALDDPKIVANLMTLSQERFVPDAKQVRHYANQLLAEMTEAEFLHRFASEINWLDAKQQLRN